MTKWSEFSFILKPSSLGGIGIFVTHDIPEGELVFAADFSPRKRKVKDVPPAFIDYCVFLNDEECLCPERFDHMEIAWYLNHSHAPNVAKTSQGYKLITLRDINAGEEILLDYNEFKEPAHLKEPYYKGPDKT